VAQGVSPKFKPQYHKKKKKKKKEPRVTSNAEVRKEGRKKKVKDLPLLVMNRLRNGKRKKTFKMLNT
jgi:hypothetical protein